MFCPKCGAKLDNGTNFCTNCGAPVTSSNQQTSNRPFSNQQNNLSAPVYTQPAKPVSVLPMNWFNFLIYFSLFASAVFNVVNAITCMTGSQYGISKSLVYSYFGGLKALDIIYGLVLFALAAFAVYVRMRLAGYCKNGPELLNKLYLLSGGLSLLYVVIASIIVSDGDYDLAYTSGIISLSVSVIMVAINTAYFKKRQHLFTR